MRRTAATLACLALAIVSAPLRAMAEDKPAAPEPKAKEAPEPPPLPADRTIA